MSTISMLTPALLKKFLIIGYSEKVAKAGV